MVYLNEGGMLQPTASWSSNDNGAGSVAWGDMDGDGDLDLAAGSSPNMVYLNEGGMLQPTAAWSSNDSDATRSVAWGDMDGDGDLDLAAGNNWAPNKVYLNEAGSLQSTAAWNSNDSDGTQSVAWGDMDGDGDLDLAAGNFDGRSKVYLNEGGMLQPIAAWSANDSDAAQSVAWGDMDGDGDLDLAIGNGSFETDFPPVKVYLNEGGSLQRTAIWTSDFNNARSVAWGDMDGDGDLDLAIGNWSGGNKVYLNGRPAHPFYAGQTSWLAISLSSDPVQTFNQTVTALAPADFYAVPGIRQAVTIPISYTLSDPAGTPARFIRAFYSPDGGGHWLPAVAASGTVTTDLSTNASHVYTWDVLGSGFFGQSDNVVFRLVAYPSLRPQPNRIPGPYQRPFVSAQTYPFRVRGSQVRVLSATSPISNALVYRLPAGQQTGGLPLGTTITSPFHTDNQGYLQGRGEIQPGDRLLALAPVPLPPLYTERYSDTLRLYTTNATPTETGLDTYTVSQPGVQELTVSPAKPLLLFDLDVSLEWDASHDPTYLAQLDFDLKKAAQHLYDFSNGQVTLGQVRVHQNGDGWDFAEVVIQASNRLRPFAVQGGIVLTQTVDPQHSDIVYDIGQVSMGATWNRYGNAGQSLGEDWPLALAHELSHYLLFLDDTYLGLNPDGLLIPVDSCAGSAMGDTYTPANTEFVSDGDWLPNCANTLSQRTLGRSEWATVKLWYPWLNTPTSLNSGPSLMPFELTTVTVLNPLTPTTALADPTFYLDYIGNAVSSSEAQGVLLRSEDGNPSDYETILDVGSPVGGQNRLLARGAQPGDRLCVFDPPRRQFGCEGISLGDERLKLERDESWTPLIQLSPVNSTTFTLQVETLPSGLTLKARLYPDLGPASAEITLTETNGVYQGQLQLADIALAGHIQLWVEEPATEDNPRRESIVAYSVGGNPPKSRGGGPKSRGGGPKSRGGGAPIVSPDGQMIFFTENPIVFQEGDFYTIQAMAGLPALPPGKKALGPSYNLVATPGAPLLTGSISFQYLGIDALVEGVNEAELTIHFWDGTSWRALATVRDSYYNLASAPSQGPGVYALLAGITPPQIAALIPTAATNDVTTTLVISGGYFLPPVVVGLVGPTAAYTLPLQAVSPTSLTVTVAQGLPAREYQVRVVNGDGGVAVGGSFALYDPAEACFYDFFESGASRWQRGGEWDIITLPSGEQAITDSPTGNYNSATPPAPTLTTAITSIPFSLANCAEPVLTFRHAYVLAKVGASQDVGRVEISTDGGATWAALASYTGGGVYGSGVQEVNSTEWTNVTWQDIEISLNSYTGTVRLRFSLEVDQTISDKGWVLDDVIVKSGPGNSNTAIFLPIILKRP
jgi:hypothetical protein